MNYLNKRAIFRGVLANFGGVVIFSLCSGFVIGLGMTDVPEHHIEAHLMERITSAPFMVLSLFVTILFSALGGAVAAKCAGFYELRHSALVGGVNLLTSTLLFQPQLVSFFYIFGFILPIPAALLGGYLVYYQRYNTPVK